MRRSFVASRACVGREKRSESRRAAAGFGGMRLRLLPPYTLEMYR